VSFKLSSQSNFLGPSKTKLYNPYSAVHFFDQEDKYVFPSWVTSGSTQVIKDKLAEWKVIPNYFQGQEIDSIAAEFPGEIDENNSTLFLYQTGYLSIRDKRGQICILDYPNAEVLQLMNSLFLKNCYLPEARNFIYDHFSEFSSALETGDWSKLINVLNRCLWSVSYPDLPQKIRSFLDQTPDQDGSAETEANTENNIPLVRPTEYFFQNISRIFIISAELHTDIVRGNNAKPRAVVVFQETGKNNPAIIATNIIADQESAQKAAKRGLQEILARRDSEQFQEPILISLAIEAKSQKITAGIILNLGLKTVWPPKKITVSRK
jgi:hypothetical protein